MVLLSFQAYQKSALLCCSQASSEIATWGVRVMLTALLHRHQTMMEEKLRRAALRRSIWSSQGFLMHACSPASSLRTSWRAWGPGSRRTAALPSAPTSALRLTPGTQ